MQVAGMTWHNPTGKPEDCICGALRPSPFLHAMFCPACTGIWRVEPGHVPRETKVGILSTVEKDSAQHSRESDTENICGKTARPTIPEREGR